VWLFSVVALERFFTDPDVLRFDPVAPQQSRDLARPDPVAVIPTTKRQLFV
jgi:hypothetical protein